VAKAEKDVKEKWDKENKPAEEDMGSMDGEDGEGYGDDEEEVRTPPPP